MNSLNNNYKSVHTFRPPDNNEPVVIRYNIPEYKMPNLDGLAAYSNYNSTLKGTQGPTDMYFEFLTKSRQLKNNNQNEIINGAGIVDSGDELSQQLEATEHDVTELSNDSDHRKFNYEMNDNDYGDDNDEEQSSSQYGDLSEPKSAAYGRQPTAATPTTINNNNNNKSSSRIVVDSNNAHMNSDQLLQQFQQPQQAYIQRYIMQQAPNQDSIQPIQYQPVHFQPTQHHIIYATAPAQVDAIQAIPIEYYLNNYGNQQFVQQQQQLQQQQPATAVVERRMERTQLETIPESVHESSVLVPLSYEDSLEYQHQHYQHQHQQQQQQQKINKLSVKQVINAFEPNKQDGRSKMDSKTTEEMRNLPSVAQKRLQWQQEILNRVQPEHESAHMSSFKSPVHQTTSSFSTSASKIPVHIPQQQQETNPSKLFAKQPQHHMNTDLQQSSRLQPRPTPPPTNERVLLSPTSSSSAAAVPPATATTTTSPLKNSSSSTVSQIKSQLLNKFQQEPTVVQKPTSLNLNSSHNQPTTATATKTVTPEQQKQVITSAATTTTTTTTTVTSTHDGDFVVVKKKQQQQAYLEILGTPSSNSPSPTSFSSSTNNNNNNNNGNNNNSKQTLNFDDIYFAPNFVNKPEAEEEQVVKPPREMKPRKKSNESTPTTTSAAATAASAEPTASGKEAYDSQFYYNFMKPEDIEREFKSRYLEIYKLSESQYSMMSDFYKKKRDGIYLRTTTISKMLVHSFSGRKEVKATEEDINRALLTIDIDNDGLIDLDEFINLLVLFFASKYNLIERLERILNGRTFTHKMRGALTPDEAADYSEFLYFFYGVPPEKQNFSFKDNYQYKEFCKLISPSIEPFLFVKWN